MNHRGRFRMARPTLTCLIAGCLLAGFTIAVQAQIRDFEPITGRRAARPGSGRLDQLAPDHRRTGVQPARPDQPRQRPEPAARLVVGNAGGDRRSHAARPRRRHVHPEPFGRRGARRHHRRRALVAPAHRPADALQSGPAEQPAAGPGRGATSPSTTTRSTPARARRSSSRSMPVRARWCGSSRWPITTSAISTRAGRSS